MNDRPSTETKRKTPIMDFILRCLSNVHARNGMEWNGTVRSRDSRNDGPVQLVVATSVERTGPEKQHRTRAD